MLSPGIPEFPKEQDNLRNLLISRFCHAVPLTKINGDLYSSTQDSTILICISTQSPATLQNALFRAPTPYFRVTTSAGCFAGFFT